MAIAVFHKWRIQRKNAIFINLVAPISVRDRRRRRIPVEPIFFIVFHTLVFR